MTRAYNSVLLCYVHIDILVCSRIRKINGCLTRFEWSLKLLTFMRSLRQILKIVYKLLIFKWWPKHCINNYRKVTIFQIKDADIFIKLASFYFDSELSNVSQSSTFDMKENIHFVASFTECQYIWFSKGFDYKWKRNSVQHSICWRYKQLARIPFICY